MIVKLGQPPLEQQVAADVAATAKSAGLIVWPSVATGVAVYVVTRLIDVLIFGGTRR